MKKILVTAMAFLMATSMFAGIAATTQDAPDTSSIAVSDASEISKLPEEYIVSATLKEIDGVKHLGIEVTEEVTSQEMLNEIIEETETDEIKASVRHNHDWKHEGTYMTHYYNVYMRSCDSISWYSRYYCGGWFCSQTKSDYLGSTNGCGKNCIVYG